MGAALGGIPAFHYYFERRLYKDTFKDLFASLKQGSVKWRRVKQNWTARSRSETYLNNSRKEQNIETSIDEIDFDLILHDLAVDLNNQNEIPIWGSGISTVLGKIMKDEKTILKDLKSNLSELDSNLGSLKKGDLSESEEKRLVERNQEIGRYLVLTLIALKKLSTEILAVSYAQDLYSEKIDSVSTGNIDNVQYLEVVTAKKQQNSINEAFITELATSFKLNVQTIESSLSSGSLSYLISNLNTWNKR